MAENPRDMAGAAPNTWKPADKPVPTVVAAQQKPNLMQCLEECPIIPRGQWVVLRPFPPETKVGDLKILEQASAYQLPMNKGVVLAIGAGEFQNGIRVPIENLSVGQTAWWTERGGTVVKVKGVEYAIVPASNLYFVEKPDS